jgi:ankyrin repeat protein
LFRFILAPESSVHFTLKSASLKQKGETALMRACNKGYLDIVALLLKNNPNVNTKSSVRSFDLKYFKLQRICIMYCDVIVLKLGYTALMGAALNGYTDICGMLLSSGADVSIRNNVRFLSALSVSRVWLTHIFCALIRRGNLL